MSKKSQKLTKRAVHKYLCEKNCFAFHGANKFFLETHFAVNEVGSTSKEELNLLLWLLREEVGGYVYGRLDLRSPSPKSPTHVNPADPVL